MSEGIDQKWTVKKAQELRKGDLISGRSGNFALEVIHVVVDDETVFVAYASDLYRLHAGTYKM